MIVVAKRALATVILPIDFKEAEDLVLSFIKTNNKFVMENADKIKSLFPEYWNSYEEGLISPCELMGRIAFCELQMKVLL